ncbi:MAG: DUF3667 domain-containing protein [Pseudomonadota bacterium]
METQHCRNCNAIVTGDFCAVCGQREGRGDLHFAEAMGDIVGDVFTWDSRFWRTLVPLLIKPGFLTAEFIAGRRARYMPPFRLYIVISFIMFLLVSVSSGDAVFVDEMDTDDGDTSLVIGIDPNSVPESMRDSVIEAQETARQRAIAEREAKAAVAEEAEQELRNAAGELGLDGFMEEDGGEDGFNITFADDAPPWLKHLEERIDANAKRVGENPEDYLDNLREYLPQVMFVMLPLFAALLKLLYLFSPFHYLQHLVFALHYHSFVYLLYILGEMPERLGFSLDIVFALCLLVYLPIALRRSYESSRWGAIGKASVIYVAYGLMLIVGMAIAALTVLAFM